MKNHQTNNKNFGQMLSKNRKSIAIHSVIIIIFLFYTFFVSEYLFYKMSHFSKEATLMDISLPAETNNLNMVVDHLVVRENLIEIEGWAYIEGQNTDDVEIYLVFKSNQTAYIYNTQRRTRHDVTGVFGNSEINLDNSGYIALIPKDKLGQRAYSIGIFIRKGSIEAFEYTINTLKSDPG